MFSYEEQYKKFEELAERLKQVNEFWVNAVFANVQDFYKPKKK